MRVDESLANELVEKSGTGSLFTLIGDETVDFVGHASRLGARIIGGRHETGTVGMADGYSRMSGEVGVAVVARGPGVSNALTSIVCATRARSGVLVIAGDSSRVMSDKPAEEALAMDPGHKYLPQELLLQTAMVQAVTLRSAETARADFSSVIEAVGRGETIVVNAPKDILRAEAGDSPSRMDFALPHSRLDVAQDVIDYVADAVRKAERPVLLAGRGAVKAGIGDELRKLGELSGALLCTTLLAKGLFSGDAYDLGVAGGFSTPLAKRLLAEADLLLVFGGSLNPMTVFGGSIFPSAEVIQIDEDPDSFGRFTAVDHSILGDVRDVTEHLTTSLGTQIRVGKGYRTKSIQSMIRDFELPRPESDKTGAGGLDPRLVMYSLDKILPHERTVVVDSGRQLTYPSLYIGAPDASSYLFPHDGGALGAALGVGLGVSFAAPERLVVVCCGDGAAMMSIAELETAVRYGRRLLLIVTNDSGFAGAKVSLKKAGLPTDAATYPGVSFENIARGFGAKGMTVSSWKDLDPVQNLISEMDGPAVIDIKTTSDVVPEWVQFLEDIHRQHASTTPDQR